MRRRTDSSANQIRLATSWRHVTMARIVDEQTAFPGQPNSVVFLTSYFWEGSALLTGLLDAGVGLTHLVIQRPWWGSRSFIRSRVRYGLNALRHNTNGEPHRYHSLEPAARRGGLIIRYIDDINTAGLRWQEKNIRLIIVAGSRIIKPPVVAKFRGKLVNFHSGLLPHYRGPYSEFWAMYEHRPDLIGCSVHLIDEGIDTGPLLATRVAQLPDERLTPQEAHYTNVLQAVPMVAETVAAYARGELSPTPQPAGGETYTHPSDDEIARMTRRIGRSFCVDFIE